METTTYKIGTYIGEIKINNIILLYHYYYHYNNDKNNDIQHLSSTFECTICPPKKLQSEFPHKLLSKW